MQVERLCLNACLLILILRRPFWSFPTSRSIWFFTLWKLPRYFVDTSSYHRHGRSRHNHIARLFNLAAMWRTGDRRQCGRSQGESYKKGSSCNIYYLLFLRPARTSAAPAPAIRQWPGSDYKMADSSLSLKFNFWSKIAEEGDKLKTVLIDDN